MTDAALYEALAASQRLGMLGARPIDEVIDHAKAFVAALGEVTGTIVDLGSGGGVPGLVVARERPDLHIVLVDRRATRTDHLRRLVSRLGVEAQVDVLTVDAASLAQRLGAPVDAVVARGFAGPAETLRRAEALVSSDGLIVISEPPEPLPDRWPAGLLDELELTAVEVPDLRVAGFRRRPRST